MQIIYISIRPQVLNTTLQLVHDLMTFVDDVLIISPSHLKGLFKNPGFSTFEIIADEDLMVFPSSEKGTDKSHLNYHLRGQMATHPKVRGEFILSDDDYRPIRPILPEFFKSKGKYHCYYFYDLEEWHESESSFDLCQQNSFVVLSYHQFSTFAFASHMPQLFNKKLLAESYQFFSEESDHYALCEWGIYFNYCVSKYQDLFHKPESYQTMCWPQVPGLWPNYIEPKKYSFENFYPENYTKNSVFENIPESPQLEELTFAQIEKLRRLRLIEIRAVYPPPLPKWTVKTFRRNLTNSIIKILLTLDHERNLPDRKRILKLKKHISDLNK